MKPFPHDSTEVLIVGAGPTGLMMACQLAVQQVSFRIIDKNNTSSQNSGALIVQARTLEIFEQLGIAGEAISEGIVADNVEIVYNGTKIAGVSIKDIGQNLSQFPFLLLLEQSKTEMILLKFLEERGFFVDRNVRFNRFTDDGSIITTKVMMPDASEQTIVSKYLIGADGSKSTIRSFLSIPFNGKSYSQPIFILDSGAISNFSSGVISFAFSRKSVVGFFPLQNQRWRIDGSFPESMEKSKSITVETVAKSLQRWNKVSFELRETEWFSVSHSQQKYAHPIRIGNCFLAGDSAHVNTPVGAQGMNAGIQDAHNLAWKLTLVLKLKAKPVLLDSYSKERLGITKGFARYADVVFRLVTSTNMAVRLLRTLVLIIFFKWIFPKLGHNEKSRLKFFKSISQINIHYKLAFSSCKKLENLFLPTTPKPGYRFPYIDFIYDGKRTNSHQILNGFGYTLIVLADELTPDIQAIADKFKLATVLLKHLPETVTIYNMLGISGSGYYLIRPDMFIELRSSKLETQILNSHMHQLLISQY